jgi:peptidoglycan-associated lipoprotein
MKRSNCLLTVMAIMLAVGLTVFGAACAKKVAPPPAAAPAPAETAAPPRAPSPAPTVSLSASPAAIEQGQTSTLRWNSTNATEVSIDGGIGTVPASGSRVVQPDVSTTYKARATGPGGAAEAEARVTVAPMAATPPPSRPLSDAEFFTQHIEDAYFDYDKYDIREDARSALTADARALNERRSLRVTIEGHCDERGSERYNLALGDRRANAAKSVLVSQGVAAERLDTVSYGEDQPFCTEHTEECWQKNRRAHFVLR